MNGESGGKEPVQRGNEPTDTPTDRTIEICTHKLYYYYDRVCDEGVGEKREEKRERERENRGEREEER